MINVLVLGRAGLDLYPQENSKIKNALSYTSDLGGSAGNIAVAIAKAGGQVGLISALSNDAVGEFVKGQLVFHGVDTSLLLTTQGNERTSLALAEVRNDDCDVVIYRNNPADLAIEYSSAIEGALSQCQNLVITGTALIDPKSRQHTLKMIDYANSVNCQIWLDIDYRAWNWDSPEVTRTIYQQAAQKVQILAGNEDEFAIMTDNIAMQIEQCCSRNQIMILKRGSNGSSCYIDSKQLNAGVYTTKALKPYGAGDAFIGNVLVSRMNGADWPEAICTGSAAAALVVSQKGCASAMPTNKQIADFQQKSAITLEPTWKE